MDPIDLAQETVALYQQLCERRSQRPHTLRKVWLSVPASKPGHLPAFSITDLAAHGATVEIRGFLTEGEQAVPLPEKYTLEPAALKELRDYFRGALEER